MNLTLESFSIADKFMVTVIGVLTESRPMSALRNDPNERQIVTRTLEQHMMCSAKAFMFHNNIADAVAECFSNGKLKRNPVLFQLGLMSSKIRINYLSGIVPGIDVHCDEFSELYNSISIPYDKNYILNWVSKYDKK